MTKRRAAPTAQARGRGRRSAAEGARTRSRVLRNAERLFARKGYSATSLRELADLCGVRMFTIHYHFGSKLRLYEAILRQWDKEVEQLVLRVFADAKDAQSLVERVVDELFDFFLANRARLALKARAVLGEGLPPRLAAHGGRSWVRFMNAHMETLKLGSRELNVGLLLITIEGILHNHILASSHYRHLFGRDVTDPKMTAGVKRHLTGVILALVGRKLTQHKR